MLECQLIFNINIGQVYDQCYVDVEVYYDVLGNLVGFFGCNMLVYWYDCFFQVYYVKNGVVWVYFDECQYLELGLMFFFILLIVLYVFVIEVDVDGYVLIVCQ